MIEPQLPNWYRLAKDLNLSDQTKADPGHYTSLCVSKQSEKASSIMLQGSTFATGTFGAMVGNPVEFQDLQPQMLMRLERVLSAISRSARTKLCSLKMSEALTLSRCATDLASPDAHERPGHGQ